MRAGKASGYFGVTPDAGYWKAYLQISPSDRLSLGRWETAEEAAHEVDRAIVRYKMDHPLNNVSAVRLEMILTSRAQKQMEDVEVMKRPAIKAKQGPEDIIQADIIKFLENKGWTVVRIIGCAYQAGLPDLFIAKKGSGQRWVEVKNPLKYKFTNAQLKMFPILRKADVPIYVMIAATEAEYAKLFQPSNWHMYLSVMK